MGENGKKNIILKLNKKSFGFFLSRCLAQTFLIFIFQMTMFFHILTPQTACFMENLYIQTTITPMLLHSPQAGSLEPSLGTAVTSSFLCSHVTRSPSSRFILRITWLFVRRLSDPSFAQIFKIYFLKFLVYICKTERSFSYFTQSVLYIYKSYTEPLIGSQAT